MKIALSFPARRDLHTERGFTLVEVVVIAGCVGLLFAIVQPSLQATLGQSRNAVCMDRLRAIGQASLTYSADDPNGWAIPVHESYGRDDPEDPFSWPALAARGRYVGAYEWGGKSGIGRDDFMGAPSPINSAYGTKAGFGPATRPLNNILYPHGFRENSARDRRALMIDTQLKLEAFHCPADDGPPDAAHCPHWLDHPQRSSYDHFGTSYASNVFMIRGPNGNQMFSNSPYLRPSTRVPNPARTLNYEENIGRWAWSCKRETAECLANYADFGVDPGSTKAVRGWHGKNWTFNRVFVDAHAETQPVYIEETEDAEGYANHYQTEFVLNLPGEGSDEEKNRASACVIVRGPGWQKDTLPDDFIPTGLDWNGAGRPSYEGCVSADYSAISGSRAGIR